MVGPAGLELATNGEAFELDDFDPDYAVDLWDITNREDWAACESVMRGGARTAGYRPGPLSNWEGPVYLFLNIMGHAYQGKGFVVPEVPTRELR